MEARLRSWNELRSKYKQMSTLYYLLHESEQNLFVINNYINAFLKHFS